MLRSLEAVKSVPRVQREETKPHLINKQIINFCRIIHCTFSGQQMGMMQTANVALGKPNKAIMKAMVVEMT